MTRRKDGLWQQQITVIENGRKKQKCFYGKTKQAVLQKIKAYKECVDSDKGKLFETVADEWWEYHQATLSPSSRRAYLPSLTRAKNNFKSSYIKEITPVQINVFIRAISTKEHMSLKTAKTQLNVVSQIFQYAVQNGLANTNPARELDVPKGLKHNARDMASSEDIALIKANANSPMGRFAFWALYTGCRRGELLALTWDDVDLEARTIAINKSWYDINGKTYTKPPKTEKGVRTIPILNKLYEHIGSKKSGLVFPGRHGMMTCNEFARAWNKYKEKTGVSCTPHQLRHAYATMLLENDVSVKDAQELLGHAQASTTQDIYQHLRDTRKQQTNEKLYGIDIA